MDFVVDKIMQWGEDASETGYQSSSAFITNDDAICLDWEQKKIMLLDLLEKKIMRSQGSLTGKKNTYLYRLKEKCILRWMKGLKTTLLTRVMAAIIFSGFMSFFNSSNALCFSRPERTSKVIIPQYGQGRLAFNKSLRHFLWMGLLQQIVISQLRKFTSISFLQTLQMPSNSGSKPDNLRERLNAIFGGSRSSFIVVC